MQPKALDLHLSNNRNDQKFLLIQFSGVRMLKRFNVGQHLSRYIIIADTCV